MAPVAVLVRLDCSGVNLLTVAEQVDRHGSRPLTIGVVVVVPLLGDVDRGHARVKD